MSQTPNKPPGAILIVEDHELTLASLTELLTRAFPLRGVHGARGAREALLKFAEVAPTVIVMDIRLPDGSGLDVTRELVARGSGARVVVHSTHDSQVFRDESLKAGASAFVSKNSVGDLVPVLGRLMEHCDD